ncbi:MAG: acyl-CoA dehydrogenase family protein [Pseudomonadales bacterium]|nr:acyl-CoA dehydrogenase family protein [Pseudomonadales bacterium]
MDLSYGVKYDDFRNEVRQFCQNNKFVDPSTGMPGVTERPSKERLSWQVKLIEHGYAARTIPKEYGGYGADPDIINSRIIQEEFIRAGLSPGMANQGISMLVPTLLEVGTEEQKKRYIEPTIKGEMIWCQGYSEPGSGSDLASLRTSAVVDVDDFVINGQKIWTSSAHVADMCFILVRTEPEAPKHRGISYLLVPMNAAGIEVRPLVTITGDATFNEVFLDDVRVPVTNMVGARGQGWQVANVTLKYERGMLGNAGQGASAIKNLEDLLLSEGHDGRRPMDNAVIRDRFVELQARGLANKYHSMRLLSKTINKEPPGVEDLIVKYSATELAHDIFCLGVDAQEELGTLMGDSPYRAEKDWQKSFLGSFTGIIGGGSANIQKNIISERGLGMPREPLVAMTNDGWSLNKKSS